MFVPKLRAIQERLGYLPKDEVEAFARESGVPLHRLHEVISFFPHFRLEPPPEVEVLVCRDLACHLRGAPVILESLRSWALERGKSVHVTSASCLGRCDQAPAAIVELFKPGRHDRIVEISGTPSKAPLVRIQEVVSAHVEGREPPVEIVDHEPLPWRIDPYVRPKDDRTGFERGTVGAPFIKRCIGLSN